jgi:tetratricopeptide (TPR) repeat protein
MMPTSTSSQVARKLSLVASLFLTGAMLFSGALLHAETPDALIKKGDVLDTKLRAQDALNCYLEAAKTKPNDCDLCVRIARQYRHLMQDASSKEEKLRLGTLALNYSQQAAAVGPNDSDAQLDPAITYGKMITLQSNKEQVKDSKLIRASAEKALQLNPKNDTAWYILGRWHRSVAGMSAAKRSMAGMIYGALPPASNAHAVNYLQTAIALNPNRLIHYIELGRTYAQMGQTAEAKKFLQKGLAMPSKEKDDEDAKAQGREVLQGL